MDTPPASDELPLIQKEDLRALFDHLDRPNPEPCTHTFKETTSFLQKKKLPVATTLRWLQENGAGCDCEVIYNVDAQWGEWTGRALSDENEPEA
jgi:hypothetical protein